MILSKTSGRTASLLLLLGTVLVLLLEYLPIQRVHQSWEDEVYWCSTCLSMLRHGAAIPSVLADFPGTQSPLRFYGPVLFWLGAAFLKVFGVSMMSWRSYTFAGRIAVLVASGVFFRRTGWSWRRILAAVFVLSLSITYSFAFSLPGRPDSWSIAILVAAMALIVKDDDAESLPLFRSPAKWLLFGMLLGLAACTTPRTWPVVASMLITSPLIISGRARMRLGAAALGILATVTCVLLPLRMSPVGFLKYVRAGSIHDDRDVSPLMHGAWGYGHSLSQITYFGLVIALIVLLQLARWKTLPRFQRWLIAFGLLNLGLTMLLVSGTLRGPTYWGFPLEISALLGLALHLPRSSRIFAQAICIVLLIYMVSLRTARELPVYQHWRERDLAQDNAPIRDTIPPGSLVYGPLGQFFYPVIAGHSDYRYLKDWTTPGRSSVPGIVGTPAPMVDACSREAFLIRPDEGGQSTLPELPHASASRIADHREPTERSTMLERILFEVPGGRVGLENRGFSLYRLRIDPQYCLTHGNSPG